MLSLDRVVQCAGTAAFGRNAVVFVWIAMAYSALMAIFLSFATVAMYYDPMDVTFFEDLERNDRRRASNTTKDDAPAAVATATSRSRRALPLDAYVHYLDSKAFYAPKELSPIM